MQIMLISKPRMLVNTCGPGTQGCQFLAPGLVCHSDLCFLESNASILAKPCWMEVCSSDTSLRLAWTSPANSSKRAVVWTCAAWRAWSCATTCWTMWSIRFCIAWFCFPASANQCINESPRISQKHQIVQNGEKQLLLGWWAPSSLIWFAPQKFQRYAPPKICGVPGVWTFWWTPESGKSTTCKLYIG